MKDALLLIDLQVDFLSDTGRLPVGTANAERVISVANRMIALFEERHCPIFVIVNQFKKTDVIGNFFRRNAAIEGTEGGRIDPRILVHDAFHFSKARGSAFTNPDFSEKLRATGIDRVVICGVYAEGCVRATAFDALKAGLETLVLSDGVASNRQAKYKWALSSMRKRGVRIMPSEEYAGGKASGSGMNGINADRF
jgi:nicotinamidase-related amidase